MIGYLLLALIGPVVLALIVWRLREAMEQGVLRMRGAVIERDSQPVLFWFNTGAAAIGLLISLGLTAVGFAGIMGLIR